MKMGKEEELLRQVLSKLDTISDGINQLNFMMVQVAGSGGVSSGGDAAAVTTAPQKVDLGPLEAKLDEVIMKTMEGSDESDKFETLRAEMEKLSSGKVQKSEETVQRTMLLLEKGLQMADLETVLLEIKDKLEELVITLSATVEVEE